MSYQRIYSVVRRIPPGRVATYGQVASLAGLPGQARQVGYALHALPDDTVVPWHRVVNAAGRISTRAIPDGALTQQLLLAREGIRLDVGGRLALTQLQWKPSRKER